MASSPSDKAFAAAGPELASYVFSTFNLKDSVLEDVRTRAHDAGLPPIHVSPYDARILEVIARAAGARRIVEIGTLAGYSGISLARALPAGGVLHTFEFEPKHAAVARESFKLAGVESKVVIHIGAAMDNLPSIEKDGPFDLVFIDADKLNYPNYLAWALKNLRTGGVVLCDNAFAWGLVTKSDNDPSLDNESRRSRAAIVATNAALADGPFRSIMIPTGEGLAMGVKN